VTTERKERENALLRELVGRYSPSRRERPAVEFLLEVFRSWGWRARIDEVGNIVGEIGEGQPTICFLGHIDTVEGEIPVRLEGGLLYGRGTVDAKGPLAAAACAAARLRHPPGKRIVIVGAVEEESPTSRGARHIVERIRPDFAIIGEPSGWDRITIGYKGIFHYRYELTAPRAHGAGRALSAPSQAVRHLAEVLNLAEAEDSSPFASLTANVLSISTGGDEFSDRVVAEVDVRLPPELSPDEVEKKIRASAGEAQIEVIEKLPAVRCGKSNALVRAFLAAIRRHGGRPRFALKTGTSDMNIAAQHWDCPMAAYGPGDSNLDHTPEEHIDLEEYQKAIDVLEAVFSNL